VVGTGAGGQAAVEPEAAGGELLASGAQVVVLGHQSLSDGATIVLSEPAAAAGQSAADSLDEAAREERS
jgi:hypothetical protein